MSQSTDKSRYYRIRKNREDERMSTESKKFNMITDILNVNVICIVFVTVS